MATTAVRATAATVGSATTTMEAASTATAVRASSSASGGARCGIATWRGATAARGRVRRAGRIRTRRRVVPVGRCIVVVRRTIVVRRRRVRAVAADIATRGREVARSVGCTAAAIAAASPRRTIIGTHASRLRGSGTVRAAETLRSPAGICGIGLRIPVATRSRRPRSVVVDCAVRA
jgi:hypothetical protein